MNTTHIKSTVSVLSKLIVVILYLSVFACTKNTDEKVTHTSDPIKIENEKTNTAEVTEQNSSFNNHFSTRLKVPRIKPLPVEGRSPEQIAMLADRPDYNLYKTLAHHVELYNHWTPLGRALLNGSKIPARDREIIMLRMGWLCQAEYEWSQHARIATADDVGMTYDEVKNIAANPNGNMWSDFEKALMTMVDELRYDALISQKTWNALATRYDNQQIMDALFTAAQYQLVSMLLNSTGIQLDPILEHRLPTDITLPALAEKTHSERLSAPRLAPLKNSEMSEEQKTMITQQTREDGSVLNLYATLIHHPRLYGPRYTFGRYLLRKTSLPAATRELLIMRTAWLINSEYEWAHHVSFAKEAGLSDEQIKNITVGADSPVWNEEQKAVIRAANELREEAFITDATWSTLLNYYDTKQMVEILFTVGGYTMTGLAVNSFGVQVEEGYPSFPE
ncbi:MAG: carboxymuconolactone decarboxylase family protein [Cellvibrionaceae bacterium]